MHFSKGAKIEPSKIVGFEVLTAETMKRTLFQHMAQGSPVELYQRFRGM
jgi:hypothetical protein